MLSSVATTKTKIDTHLCPAEIEWIPLFNPDHDVAADAAVTAADDANAYIAGAASANADWQPPTAASRWRGAQRRVR
jgi:hypothetical protein